MDSSDMVGSVWIIFFLGTIPYSSSNPASDPNPLDAININLNIRATAKQGPDYSYLKQNKDNGNNVEYVNEANQLGAEIKHFRDLLNRLKFYDKDNQYIKEGPDYKYLQQIRHKHKDHRKNVKYGNETNQFKKESKHLGDVLNLLKLYVNDNQYGKKGSEYSYLQQNKFKNKDYSVNLDYGIIATEFEKENRHLRDLINFYDQDEQYGQRGCFHEDDIIYANDDPNNDIKQEKFTDFGTHWSACRQMCNANDGCKFWTFIRKEQSSNHSQCSLMASYSNRTSESLHDEVISGNACLEINELNYWENKRIQDYCKGTYTILSQVERAIERTKRKIHKLPQDACEVAALSYRLTLKTIFGMADNDGNKKLSSEEIDKYFDRAVQTWRTLSEFWKYFFSEEKKSFILQYGHIEWMVDKLDNYTRKEFYSEYRILEFKVVWIFSHNITNMTPDEKEKLRWKPGDEGFNSDGEGEQVFAWLDGKDMIDQYDIDGDNMINFYECKLYMDKEFFKTCGSCHSTCEESDICNEKVL